MLTQKWPVLTYGETPHVDRRTWTFRCFGLVEQDVSWTWEELGRLPRVVVKSDVHCVTRWSRFDNLWEGVSVREVLERVRVRPEAVAVMVHAEQGYTTNIPLDELRREDVLLAFAHDGSELPVEHGGPCRLVVPKLYFWKSAKWVRAFEFLDIDAPGFWEHERLSSARRSLERGALLGPGDARHAANAHRGGAPPARRRGAINSCVEQRSLVLIEILVGDVVHRHLTRTNFTRAGALRVLDPRHHAGFERVPFLEQLVDALRIHELVVRESLKVSRLRTRRHSQLLESYEGFHYVANFPGALLGRYRPLLLARFLPGGGFRVRRNLFPRGLLGRFLLCASPVRQRSFPSSSWASAYCDILRIVSFAAWRHRAQSCTSPARWRPCRPRQGATIWELAARRRSMSSAS